MLNSWCTIQLGAREHYAVPRALYHTNQLRFLLTDLWAPATHGLNRLPQAKRLAERFHGDLVSASVVSPSLRSLGLQVASRLPFLKNPWSATILRNQYFQSWAARQLNRRHSLYSTLFSYSYTALDPFSVASRHAKTCVLGQIDPGEYEEALVLQEHRRYRQLLSGWKPAPSSYWSSWFSELQLADYIVVNSSWSKRCLLAQGVPSAKIRVIPLVYTSPSVCTPPPPTATPSDPFQLLFLGTICLRKGIGRLLQAMELLRRHPVQLTLVGPTEIDPIAWCDTPNVRWFGAVSRSAVDMIYKQSNVMILPTLSDGFALTQLEALSYGCPVIASANCGDVVRPGVNGWLLPDLEPETIATTILESMDTLQLLPRPLASPLFGMADLASSLSSLSGDHQR